MLQSVGGIIGIVLGIVMLMVGNSGINSITTSGSVGDCDRYLSTASFNLTPNADLVPVSGYTALTDSVPGGGGFGSAANDVRHIFNYEHDSRVRQSGTVAGVTIETGSNIVDVDLSEITVQVWTSNGSAYDLVGESNNILSDMQSAGNSALTTFSLSTPITGVSEGDFSALKIVSTGTASNTVRQVIGTNTNASYIVDTAVPSTTAYDWEAQTGNANYVRMQLLMTAPSIVFIGDSLTAGHNDHYSFVETTDTTSVSTSYPYKVGQSLGVPIQNVAIGGSVNNAADGEARFTEDVISLKPKVVVIGYGSSDVEDSVSISAYSADMQLMITEAKNAGITPVISKILPRDYDTLTVVDTKDTQRIAFNAELDSLASSNNIIAIDNDSMGDGNSPLAMNASYLGGDGLHLNDSGYTAYASLITSGISGSTSTTTNLGYDQCVGTQNNGYTTLNIISVMMIITGVIITVRGFILE